MSVSQRAQALLDLVEQQRSDACASIVGEARAQAAALVARARADARRLVAQAFADERARVQAELDAARADLQTRRRLHEQHELEALLARTRQRLPAALHRRWADARTRRQWIDQALRQARAQLGPGPWTVQRGSAEPPDDSDTWAGIAAPRFESGAGITAGLRIVDGANVVDATLEALLADRDETGGRLVGLLQSQVRP